MTWPTFAGIHLVITLRRGARPLGLVAVAACSSESNVVPANVGVTPPPAAIATQPLRLPPLVVATPDARIFGTIDEKTYFARPRSGLPLTVDALGPTGATVRVVGAVEIQGFVRRDALGSLVCDPGPIGDHFYLGRGNIVTLRSNVDAGQIAVGGAVTLRAKRHVAGIPFGQEFRTVPFEASLPVSRLCAEPPRGHAGTNDDPILMVGAGETSPDHFPPNTRQVEIGKDAAVSLLATPSGASLYDRPGDEWGYSLYVIAESPGYYRVAAGSGPYLLGWIPSRGLHAQVDNGSGGLGLSGEMEEPEALYEGSLQRFPLVHIPVGSKIYDSAGGAVALFKKRGQARVKPEKDAQGRVAVIAAVDDDLVVCGWIDAASLGAPVDSKTHRAPTGELAPKVGVAPRGPDSASGGQREKYRMPERGRSTISMIVLPFGEFSLR